MAEFLVTAIIDGDTFEVSPNWQWRGDSGNRVRPTGFDAPELGMRGAAQATERLRRLILNQRVQLGGAYRVDRGRLVCDVFIRGRPLSGLAA